MLSVQCLFVSLKLLTLGLQASHLYPLLEMNQHLLSKKVFVIGECVSFLGFRLLH